MKRFQQIGVVCLLVAGTVFFLGQIVAQAGSTAPYDASRQAISDLGITSCGNFQEAQTKERFYVCSPLHTVMNATLIAYGVGIMLAVGMALRVLWTGKKLRTIGLVLLFFGGIEAVVSGFSPLDKAAFLHSLSGGLAIAALNIGLIFLGTAALKMRRFLGWFTLVVGVIGMAGMVMDGTPPYAGLGYGGWERVAGGAFAVWAILVAILFLYFHFARGLLEEGRVES